MCKFFIPIKVSMSGTDGKALTKKFNAETAVLRMLEQTNAREKHVPPALKALQAAKERSAAAAASMDKTSSNVKTLAGEWSALSIPPPTFKGDGSTSTLAENALPIMQSEVRALPDMMIVDPADQERIAKRLQDFKEKFVPSRFEHSIKCMFDLTFARSQAETSTRCCQG